jgi:hypothetical protein
LGFRQVDVDDRGSGCQGSDEMKMIRSYTENTASSYNRMKVRV